MYNYNNYNYYHNELYTLYILHVEALLERNYCMFIVIFFWQQELLQYFKITMTLKAHFLLVLFAVWLIFCDWSLSQSTAPIASHCSNDPMMECDELKGDQRR